jgi:dTDP-4-dehydrorhamnose 3,5-epimerase
MAPELNAIDGVRVMPLARIADARGAVLRMLRADDPHFSGFGEIYFSLVNPGAVKAWRTHARTTANYAVPVGTVRLVLFDDREASPTRGRVSERVIGEPDYCLVTIPPGIWTGFRGESADAALVANCTTAPHDPAEVGRLEADAAEIPYRWVAR